MEYEIGQTYVFDGRAYVYKGGPPDRRSSWSEARAETAESRLGKSRLSPLVGGTLDFLQRAAHTASLGWADEAIGLVSPEKGAAWRQRAKDLGELNPMSATLPADILGAALPALLPAAAGVRAAGAGHGLLGVGAAAGLGTVEGGLIGMGEAEGTFRERLPAAVGPAAIGAGVGALAGAVPIAIGAATRRAAARGERVAAETRRLSGVETKLKDAWREANADVRRVSDQYFKPIDEQFRAGVVDPDIDAFLTRIGRKPAERGAPTVRYLQRVRSSLDRAKDFSNVDELTDLMEAKLPGYAEANAAYSRAVRERAQLKAGSKLWNASADAVELAQEALSPPELYNFQIGRVHEVTRRLRQNDTEAHALLRRWLDAGPETEDQIRTLFRTAPAKNVDEFMGVLRREKSAKKVGDAMRRLLPAATFGAGLAGGLELLRGDGSVAAPSGLN